MQHQSPFVKATIWFMIFLMSVGFVALVITPFIGGASFFADDSGRGATEELVDEARADIEKDRCAEGKPPTGARLERCKDALETLASGYRTLASPNQETGEQPRDAKRNTERSNEAYKTLYELDPADDDNAGVYAAVLRDSGKSDEALKILDRLVKENPEDEDYLLQKAAVQESAQQFDPAIATYRLFIKKFPESGQIDGIREQIKAVQEQKAQQAAGGAGGLGGAGGDLPINIG